MQWWLGLVLGVCITFALHFLVFFILGVVAKHTSPRWDDLVVRASRAPSLVVVELSVLLVLVRGWDEVSAENEGKLTQALRVLVIVALMWWAYKVADSLFVVAVEEMFVPSADADDRPSARGAGDSLLHRLASDYELDAVSKDADTDDSLALREAHRRALETKLVVLKRIVVVFITFFGTIGILSVYDELDNFSNLLLVQGSIVALIVGMSARPLISNLIANLMIAFTQPLKLGDTVSIKDEYGTVEELCSTYLVLRIWDERRLIVPLVDVISGAFVNLTRTTTDLTGAVTVWVDYALDVEPVREFVTHFVQSHAAFDGRAVSLVVLDVTETAKQLRVTATAANASDNWTLRCDLREALIAFIAREFPSALPRRREAQVA